MRRILLLLAATALLALPAAAVARAQSHTAAPAPGFLVVRNASTDGGITGKPVATVVVRGFVVGHIAQEGKVQIYRLASSAGSLAAQVAGVDVLRRAVTYYSHGVGVPGTEFSGSDFRFRAVGGVWRVVVYGAGVSLYAGGVHRASLHGSVFSPASDGVYAFDDERFASLPSGVVTRNLGKK